MKNSNFDNYINLCDWKFEPLDEALDVSCSQNSQDDNAKENNQGQDLNQASYKSNENTQNEGVQDNNGQNNDQTNGNNQQQDSNQNQAIENINQMGTSEIPVQKQEKEIQCITIIGEIEGHFMGSPQKKATKYEHIIPMLYSIEENEQIKGVLIILNTVGGDVEAGLAMAELINSLSKKVVTLVLGGSHSIGVPLATAGDYSFIAPSATMIIHPVRTNGLVIGVNETFEYFKKMQERINDFITRTSNISKEDLDRLMHAKDELVSDVGSVLIGKEAVDYGLIDEVGGLKESLSKLKNLIKENNDK